jgi:protein phosphatase-4 regulatory subunit 3
VYELRDASWFDRGTGQCKGVYDDTQDLALIIVEAEDMSEGKDGEGGGAAEGEGGFLKEELLLSTKVEKEDIYARQQGMFLLFFNPSGEKMAVELICRYTDSMDGTSE